MTIIETSREFTKGEKYLLTMSPDTIGFKDIQDGKSFPVMGYLVFEDTKEGKNGQPETSTVLSILSCEQETGEIVVYAGQSQTFLKSLKDIEGIMEDEPFNIIKISGKTNAGRDYVDCKLDVSLLK